MYELIQAAPRAYYIQCPAKMGLWVPDGQHAVLIDSGGDKDAGRKVQKILGVVLELCREPIEFEELLQKLFTYYQLTMDFSQYVLVGSTVRSYLSWLHDSGELEAEFTDNTLRWKRR